MHLIKKYANRKLYHTNEKQYITLDGIAKLVQEGEAVQVLDNESGEDITPTIFAQVALQARGRSHTQIPTQLLTGLIQVGGDTLSNLRRSLLSSLNSADVVDAEIERRIERLVNEGALAIDEAVRVRQMLLRRDLSAGAAPAATLLAPELPSKGDMLQLHAQVDALAAIVDQLLQERAH